MAGSTVRHEILSNSIIHLLLLLLSLFHPSITSYYGLISPPPLPPFRFASPSLQLCSHERSRKLWVNRLFSKLSLSLFLMWQTRIHTQLKGCWIQNYEPCFHDNKQLHSPVIMLLCIFWVLFLTWCVIITPLPPHHSFNETLILTNRPVKDRDNIECWLYDFIMMIL